MAQELLDLLPKRISPDEWTEDLTAAVDSKIRQNPSILREFVDGGPLAPFHRLLGRCVPLSIVETILNLDPGIVTLLDGSKVHPRLPLEVLLQGDHQKRISQETFELILRNTVEKIPGIATRRDDNHNTLLHKACFGSATVCRHVIEFLHQHNPEGLLARNKNGHYPIHGMRCLRQSLPAIQYMVEQHPELLMEPDQKGNLLLHKACEEKFRPDAVLEYILQANPRAAARVPNQAGCLALHLAVRARKPIKMENLRALLQAYPEAIRHPTKRGYCPLHACLAGQGPIAEMVPVLLEANPEAAQQMTKPATTSSGKEEDPESSHYWDRDEYLPLHLACRASRQKELLAVVQALVEAYPQSIHIPTGKLGILPFHIACSNQSADLALLQYLADKYHAGEECPPSDDIKNIMFRTPDHRGSLPLHIAVVRNQKADCVEWLLSQYPEAMSHQDYIGMTPIHLLLTTMLRPGQPMTCLLEKWIVDYPALLEVAGYQGALPLHHACRFDTATRQGMIAKILELYPEGASVPTTTDGHLPFHILCSSGSSPNLAVLQVLLKANPKGIQATTHKGHTPLHVALAAGQKLPFIQTLVDLYPKALEVASSNGRLPLHMACEYRCDLDVVQYLTKLSPKAMTTPSACGRLPLHYCCAFRPQTQTLFGGGRTYPEDEYPQTFASQMEIRHLSRAFEGHGHRAVPGRGTIEWICQDFPPTAKATDESGWTALHAACANALYVEAIHALVEANPQATRLQDNQGWIPLHCAVAWGHPREIIHTNITIGQSRPITQEEWEAPLRFDYCPCKKGAKGYIIDCLLEVDPNSSLRTTDTEGWLPLHCGIASGTKHEALYERYGECFPEAYAAATFDGSLPLHIFAARKLAKMEDVEAKKLIALNPAALETKDKLGRTPLDVARDHGIIESDWVVV